MKQNGGPRAKALQRRAELAAAIAGLELRFQSATDEYVLSHAGLSRAVAAFSTAPDSAAWSAARLRAKKAEEEHIAVSEALARARGAFNNFERALKNEEYEEQQRREQAPTK